MNKGTIEGTKAEIDFVKYMNKNKNSQLWNLIKKDFRISDLSNYYYIRVTKHVISHLNNKKVFPKSDAYIIKTTIPNDFLIEHDYFLDEENYNVNEKQILIGSGTSIKRPDSSKFQIIKMVPDSFYKLFNNYYLGAAASLYCNAKELNKNDCVINGWKTSWQELEDNLPNDLNIKSYTILDEENKVLLCSNIKKYANDKIKHIILNDSKLTDIVFKGKYIYDEPYCAKYLFINNNLEYNKPFDFCVTTGSGRSKGIFTIVLKPKN